MDINKKVGRQLAGNRVFLVGRVCLFSLNIDFRLLKKKTYNFIVPNAAVFNADEWVDIQQISKANYAN